MKDWFLHIASSCLLMGSFIIGSNNAAAATCEVKIQIADEAKTLSRYLDNDGAFSFEIYTSEAAEDITASFYWRHAPGSGRQVVPTLDISFQNEGFKKLRSGSYFTIDGDGSPQMVLQRLYNESWNNDFKLQNADLFTAFPNAKKVTVRLMLPSKKGSAKIQAEGTLDMIKLRQEIDAFGPADILLDQKHKNFEEACTNQGGPPQIQNVTIQAADE
jgi:hypothetical protein